MKTLMLFLALMLISGAAHLNGQEYKAMTFNIRYNNPNDGENWWEKRKTDVVRLVDYYHPDFLGIQEGLHDQVIFIHQGLSNYQFIGVGRDDGANKGEYSALYYNTEQFTLLEQTTFWLSETPEKISKAWDAALPRICTYGKFQEKNGERIIHVFNTHFDHIGKIARKNSAKLIIKKINELAGTSEAVVVMGDLNSEPGSAPIQTFLTGQLLKDAKFEAKYSFTGPKGTFNSFDPNNLPDRRIDYIFVNNLLVNHYRHIDDRTHNGLCVSDHLPVMIRFNFP